MPGRVSIACIVLCGCGRLAFDDLADAPSSEVSAVTLSYPTENLIAVQNTSSISLTPTVTGGPVAFSVTPALPAGLVLAPTTGTITGTPTAEANRTSYVVTASNSSGSASVTLYASIAPGYVVDTTADGLDDDGGVDATCFSTAAAGCSLRAAVQTANRRTTPQLVLLGANTYTIGGALEDVANGLVIAGVGSAQTIVRAPTLHAGYQFAKLASQHTLSVMDLRVDGFGSVNGGAIAVLMGELYVDECDFQNNDSAGSGGVLFINGAAHALLEHSTFENNTSFGGCCGGWGGVIDGEGSATTVIVRTSTAVGNSTGWGSFAHITTGTTLTLENSTLYGNMSTISGTLASPGGVYTLTNDTIAYNTNTNTSVNGSDLPSAGIYLYNPPSGYTLTNVILAHNTMTTGAERSCSHRVVGTTVTTKGGNVVTDDAYNCGVDFTATTDRLTTEPGLDPAAPASHGGETPTMLLVPGSPSIDTGVNDGCPATDQRGVPRPIGPQCDVGAVEME